MGFEDEGDAVKWRKHGGGGGQDRRRSSGRRDVSNGGGGGGCIYEGTSVGDKDVFGEKLREESVVVIQVKNSLQLQGSPLFCANIVKKDPGRARQNSLATAGINFTKPGAQNKVDPCIMQAIYSHQAVWQEKGISQDL